MKIIKAVSPYIYPNGINFKHKPYEAWKELGGNIALSHYPIRILHGFFHRFDFPSMIMRKDEARLRFVQPWTLEFDTFPDYICHERIPFFWDVWPNNYKKTFSWLKKHKINTAIFTSSQIANIVKQEIPQLKVFSITEGIDVYTYKQGFSLKERQIDFLEYGREINNIVKYDLAGRINYVKGKKDGRPIFTHKELINNLANAKIVATYPKSWTNPDEARGIETLTQRYWEAMLSRCVMIGHAPEELVRLLGYNPVIEIDLKNPQKQLIDILNRIEDFQELVDRNRENAIYRGDWKYSMQRVMTFLQDCGYRVSF